MSDQPNLQSFNRMSLREIAEGYNRGEFRDYIEPLKQGLRNSIDDYLTFCTGDGKKYFGHDDYINAFKWYIIIKKGLPEVAPPMIRTEQRHLKDFVKGMLKEGIDAFFGNQDLVDDWAELERELTVLIQTYVVHRNKETFQKIIDNYLAEHPEKRPVPP